MYYIVTPTNRPPVIIKADNMSEAVQSVSDNWHCGLFEIGYSVIACPCYSDISTDKDS